LGRFVTRDPIGRKGGGNLYGYAGSSPTIFTDPNGLWRRLHGDIWQAGKGDTFKKLAEKVGKSGVAKFAIRPIPASDKRLADLMQRAWGLRPKPMPYLCGRYSTRYLTHPPKQSGKLSIGLGMDNNDYLMRASGFFHAETMTSSSDTIRRIGTQTRYGQSPLEELWIVGHGRRGRHRTGNTAFQLSVGDFKLNGRGPFDFPLWGDAVSGRLTPGFWFGKESKVYFIGCNTGTLATAFANAVLWKSANAFGTDTEVWAKSRGEMGWGEDAKKQHDDPMAASPEQFFESRHWGKPRPGATPYPF
jgi:hypothetical protein